MVSNSSNYTKARIDMEKIYTDVLGYQYENGKFPDNLYSISTILDPWGTPYNYKKDDKTSKFAVWSNGTNKVDDSSNALPVPTLLRDDDTGVIIDNKLKQSQLKWKPIAVN